MKTLIVLVLLLGLAGFFLYRQYLTPEKRSCARLAELCGFQAHDHEVCMSRMGELRRQASSESLDKFHNCVSGAKTCAEGGGCLVGAGLSAAGNVLHQFIEGIGKTLKH